MLFNRDIVEPIQHLKLDFMGNKNPRLHTDEILIALTISALNSDVARKAKFIIVSYPLNPVCVTADDSVYEALIRFAEKYENKTLNS